MREHAKQRVWPGQQLGSDERKKTGCVAGAGAGGRTELGVRDTGGTWAGTTLPSPQILPYGTRVTVIIFTFTIILREQMGQGTLKVPVPPQLAGVG